MRKKTIILIISYMAAAIAVASGFAVSASSRLAYLERVNTASSSRAFSNLVSNVSDIDSSLQKCLYATSPSVECALCTDIFGKAQAAQAALGELPFSGLLLEKTSGFLGTVGDYSFMLSREASSGNVCSGEELENLSSLSSAASMLSSCLTDLQTRVSDGSLSFQELSESETLNSDFDSMTTLGQGFSLIETDFPEIPGLIYDGPFSQHINAMKPLLLEGKEEISAEKALEKAKEFTGESSLTLQYERDGNLPVYCFACECEGGTVSAEVTKAGGEVLSIFRSYPETGEASISSEEAIEKARVFLSDRGYTDMKESYLTVSDGSALINFAPVQSSVVCYPDLVKVAVSLTSGNITGFEALGYIMNHTIRDLPTEIISENDAQAKVSPALNILSHSLAIIPTDGKYEKFCHEFVCENENGQHYIVYVNAVSNEQEKLLILIEDDSGTLTL